LPGTLYFGLHFDGPFIFISGNRLLRDGNASGSGQVDRKPDPRKNIVRLNLIPESELAGEIWHANPSGFGSGSGVRRVL
jgi:hypothetical protein